MEESSRPPPHPPEMEFLDSMGMANGSPDILNMFNFIDSIGPSVERVDNGGAVPYVTREQRMYAAEYCRLQDMIDTLSKEKEELKDKVSRCEHELLKAREPRIVSVSSAADKAMILELKKNENTLQSKLSDQTNQFEHLKCQVEVQNVKVREQEEAIEKYKSELDEATNTVLEREQEINEYRGVVATQKALLEKKEEKISEDGRNVDRLKKETGNLQQELGQKEEVISSLQDKLSNLGGDLKTKQNEVEDLKQSLENERKGKKDSEANFMKLQKSVSNFNLGFSQFIDELKTISNFEGAEPSSSGPTTASISLENKLELVASRVKNKFQSLQDSQTMAKEELARIKEVVLSLKLMLDSPRPVNEAQVCHSTQTELLEPPISIPTSINEAQVCQSIQTERFEQPIPIPISVNESSSAVEAASSTVLQKPSYSSVVQASLTSEAGLLVPQSIFPADNFEFPALIPPLSSMGIEADIDITSIGDDIQTVANGMARGSRKIHGVDSSKSHLGLFCLCGHKYLNSKTLKVHIQYFTREWKFKCKLCTRRFFNLVYLNRHMHRHHGVKNSNKKGWSGCTECGQKFPSRTKLCQHKKTVHTVKLSRKAIIMKHIQSKLMSQPKPIKKSLGNTANTSNDEVPKISLKKGKTRSQSSRWNVVSNENDSSSSMIWESFDEDNTTEQDNDVDDDDDDNTKKTDKPSTSKSVADNPRHGQDNSREASGYFCFCGYHHPFDKRRLLYHIQYFTVEPKFSCQLCGKRFIGSNYLRKHCQRVHNITCADSTGCWKCGEQFENRKLLVNHQKIVHGRTRNNIAAQHKSTLSVGLTSQDNEPSRPSADQTSNETSVKLVNSSDAEKKSARKFKIIIKHRKLLSRNGNSLPILCVCGYKAKNEDCFRKHVKYFYNKCHFVCEVCDKGFKTTSNLRTHMQSAHQMSYNLKGCRLCGKEFDTLEKLRYHQSVKHANRTDEDVTNVSSAPASQTNVMPPPPLENSMGTSFSTTTSSRSTKSSLLTRTSITTALQTSKRKHGVDLSKRNLGCYCICGTKQSDRKALNHHIHYFTADRKFQCTQCNLKFLHLARLKAHMKRKHKSANTEELGTVGCSDCGFTFHSHLELFQHRKIHSSIEGASNSTPNTFAPAVREHGINSPNSPIDDRAKSGDAISSLTVTTARTATTHISSPAPKIKARSTPHAVNPQSQTHPQAKRASTASSAISVHKSVRIWNNRDVFYCLCGIQFETDLMLQRHIIDEDVRSAENQSRVQSAQVWTPPSHLNLNNAVKATSVKRKNDDVNAVEVEASPPIPLSHSAPSSSASTKTDKSRLLTHAIDKSKENFGIGLFCTCGLGFKSKGNLDQHLGFHRNGKKFSCQFCERKIKKVQELNKHMKARHGCNMARRSQFGCRSCGQIFSSGEEISKHRTKIFTPAGKLARSFCPSLMLESTNSGMVDADASMVQQTRAREADETAELDSLETHLDTTTVEGYEVSLDSLITNRGVPQLASISIGTGNSSAINVETNQQRSFLEPQLVPPESQDRPTHGVDTSKSYLGCICFCGQQCSNKHTLNKHIKHFTAERKFICKTCGKGFLAPSLLQKHMLRVHKVVSNGSIGCHKCGELFPTNMELYHHFRIVHNYGCAWEPRELKYSPSVQSASQDFSQEEPIIVQTDPTAAATNGDERNAPQVHTALPVDPLAENKVYQCSCQKAFFARKRLNAHIQMKTVGKIFHCLWCSHRCETHGNLKIHVKKTHKMDYQNHKYACGICAQTFATSEDVTKHRRTTHENWTKKMGKSSSSYSSSINHAMEQ